MLEEAGLDGSYRDELRACIASSQSNVGDTVSFQLAVLELPAARPERYVVKIAAFDPSVIEAIRVEQADAFHHLGQLEEALVEANTAYVANAGRLGPGEPAALRALHTQGQISLALGRFDEALHAAEAISTERTEVYGRDHSSVVAANYLALNALVGIAVNASVGQEDFDAAIALAEERFDRMERHPTMGWDHPYSLSTTHLLAECYLGVGRTSESLDRAKSVEWKAS
ncbi:MAG: tetratricopeptide (TPR) repeat protein [Paracrocinitomix sp.]|jgi:tetratricopeptide (TPR) repeat protein